MVGFDSKDEAISKEEWTEYIDAILNGSEDKTAVDAVQPSEPVSTVYPLQDDPRQGGKAPNMPDSGDESDHLFENSTRAPLGLPSTSEIIPDTSPFYLFDTPEDVEPQQKMPLSVEKCNDDRISFIKKIVIALAIVLFLVIATWYYLPHDKTIPGAASQAAGTISTSQSSTVQNKLPAVKPAEAVLPAATLSPVPSAKRDIKDSKPFLPAFIPSGGRDVSFRSKEPGWERYVGAGYEYRLYRKGGRIGAIQVFASKGGQISPKRIETILKELTASTDYTTVSSKEEQAGFKITQGKVGEKADILIYRKRDTVRALVISLK